MASQVSFQLLFLAFFIFLYLMIKDEFLLVSNYTRNQNSKQSGNELQETTESLKKSIEEMRKLSNNLRRTLNITMQIKNLLIDSADASNLEFTVSPNIQVASVISEGNGNKIEESKEYAKYGNNVKLIPSNANPDRLCTQNPYTSSLNHTLDEIAASAQDWLSKQQQIEIDIISRSKNAHNHIRFDAFKEMTSCNFSCMGGRCGGDDSKIVCGLSALNKTKETCIIYSVGSNNEWDFEVSMLEKTSCEIHTFDCTGSKSRFKVPKNDRLHFHHICLSDKYKPAPAQLSNPPRWTVQGEMMTLLEMQKKLKHNRIDILKFDIEGYEWRIFEAWPQLTEFFSLDYVLPFQILFEVHTQTQMRELASGAFYSFKYESDLVRLAAHLLKVGYVTVKRDNNVKCKHCSELTMIRYKCPESI